MCKEKSKIRSRQEKSKAERGKERERERERPSFQGPGQSALCASVLRSLSTNVDELTSMVQQVSSSCEPTFLLPV